jgi:uncharacterized protein involved in outer membrane biogenesis
LKGFELDLGLKGPDLEKLFRVIGVPTPSSPPYDLKGKLQLEGTTWRVVDLTGKVGGSDVSGIVSIDAGGERDTLRAQLESSRARLIDLAEMVGIKTTRARKSPSNAASGLASTTQPDAERLRAMDVDVSYRAAHVEPAVQPIESVSLHLTIENGKLRASPLRLSTAGGTVDVDLQIDASRDRVASAINLDARDIEVGRLLKRWGFDGTGLISARGDFYTGGDSLATMLEHGDGHLVVMMSRGQISRKIVDLAGMDLVKALDAPPGEMTKVECAIGDFVIQNGQLRPTELAIVGERTTLTGRGAVNLRDETVQLSVTPHSKRPMAIPAPDIIVEGALSHPHVSSASDIQAGAAAIVDSILAPLTSLSGPTANTSRPRDCSVVRR